MQRARAPQLRRAASVGTGSGRGRFFLLGSQHLPGRGRPSSCPSGPSQVGRPRLEGRPEPPSSCPQHPGLASPPAAAQIGRALASGAERCAGRAGLGKLVRSRSTELDRASPRWGLSGAEEAPLRGSGRSKCRLWIGLESFSIAFLPALGTLGRMGGGRAEGTASAPAQTRGKSFGRGLWASLWPPGAEAAMRGGGLPAGEPLLLSALMPVGSRADGGAEQLGVGGAPALQGESERASPPAGGSG